MHWGLCSMSFFPQRSPTAQIRASAFKTGRQTDLLEWHKKKGHSGPERYNQPSLLFEDVPSLNMEILRGL